MAAQTKVTHDAVARPRQHRDALLYVCLILAGTIPYLNTLSAGFVYDDNYQVVGNPYLRSFHYLKQIILTSVWSFKYVRVPTNYYRPLMSLQYFILYQIYGPLAYPYHLVNVVMHVLVVVLLFAVTRRLFNSESLAFVAAALFALHPIHTEVVAWVAAVPDLHLAIFLLIAMWFYMDLGESARRRWWTPVAMSAAFFLALFSKEPAIAFPIIAMFYEHFLRADRAATNWIVKLGRYAPLWVLTGFYLSVRVLLIGGLVPKLQRPQLSWPSTILSSVSLFGEYMNKLVSPVRLVMFYPFVPTGSIFDPSFIAGAAWIVAVLFLGWLLWRKNRVFVMALLWMVATLSPALNARWMPGNVFAERYLYVPSMGFCWIAAAAVLAIWNWRIVRRTLWLRVSLATAAVVFVALLGIRIVTRNAVWHDDLSLFKDSVKQDPESADLHSDLGFAYWAIHDEKSAIEEWHVALAHNPNSVWALDNLAMADVSHKAYSEAVPKLLRATKIRPEFTDAHLNLAAAYLGLGQNADAEAQYLAAIGSSPLDWDAHNLYGDFCVRLGRIEDAQKQYLASLAAEPNTQAMDSLGDIALGRGQSDLAEKYFRQAADLDEYDHHAHYQLTCIYGNSGRAAEALREYQLGQQTDVGTDPLAERAKAVAEKLKK